MVVGLPRWQSLIFLIQFHSPLLNRLPLCNLLGILGCSCTVSLALSFRLLALQLLLAPCFLLLSCSLTLNLTFLFELTLCLLFILEHNQ